MSTSTASRTGQADLVLTGARVIDPETGLDEVRNVAITNGTVTAVADVVPPARQRIDVSGHILAPGFIDLHSHAQNVPGLQLQALDGVTTALELEAGAFPVSGSYAAAASEGRPINYGFSASWASARMHVLDGVNPGPDAGGALSALATYQGLPRWRAPGSPRELVRIRAELEHAVGEGAIGIGVLLGYAPETGRTEYVQLAGLAERLDTPIFTHTRYHALREPQTSMEAALEVIAAAAATGAHMHLCHLNSTSNRSIDDIATAIEKARTYGLNVTSEAYPYGAGSTVLGAQFLAPEMLERQGMTPRSLTHVATGEQIADDTRLRELRSTDPGGLATVRFLDEDDANDRRLLQRSLLLDDTAIATDAMPLTGPDTTATTLDALLAEGHLTHPRSAGTYARFFRWLVRDTGLLTWTEAVRRCTLLPAQILATAAPAISRKGRVQTGADADIVVLNPDGITDQATYRTVRASQGIQHVLVGGTFVVRDGELVTDARPGMPVHGRAA